MVFRSARRYRDISLNYDKVEQLILKLSKKERNLKC